MVIKYTEKIAFKNGEFQVERRFPDKRKPHEFFPISQWGFAKNITTMAIVKRFSENLESLDEPSNVTFYEIALSYEVLESPLAKSIVLKAEKVRKILNESLNHYEVYTVVSIKDLRTGILSQAQPENLEGFPYSMVKVSKSRPKRVDFARAKELLDSGELIGIFNDKELREQVV
jgi:hypothetical protein